MVARFICRLRMPVANNHIVLTDKYLIFQINNINEFYEGDEGLNLTFSVDLSSFHNAILES
jgi:hypothetical protein